MEKLVIGDILSARCPYGWLQALTTAVFVLAGSGCTDSSSPGGPADTGPADGTGGPADLGRDAGSAERDMGRSDATAEMGFQVGSFDPDWGVEETTRMFWGLADEACLRFRSVGGSGSARAEVQFEELFASESWVWRFGREGQSSSLGKTDSRSRVASFGSPPVLFRMRLLRRAPPTVGSIPCHRWW